jgi:hypothetical protein
VLALAFGHILNEPQATFHMKYLSAMKHGVAEPGISVMAADKKIKDLPVQPCFGPYVWNRVPSKRAARNSLIEIIHPQRGVDTSIAETSPFVVIVSVAVRLGINQAGACSLRDGLRPTTSRETSGYCVLMSGRIASTK